MNGERKNGIRETHYEEVAGVQVIYDGTQTRFTAADLERSSKLDMFPCRLVLT